MTIYFTSDTHFGHARIIELCNRPFKDVDHMNREIVRRWNEVVEPDDFVFHLGDVALGQIDHSLPVVSRLNGYKILVNGNHDRPFMNRNKARFDEWMGRYSEVFQSVVMDSMEIELANGETFLLSHFPYDGDSHGDDRYVNDRPLDNGYTPLIHGHTHKTDILTYSSQGTPQIHVGVDAHDYRPVSEDELLNIYTSS